MNEGLIISTISKSVFILANSADPDETPLITASHLGLRWLYMFLFHMHSTCSTSAYFGFKTSYTPAETAIDLLFAIYQAPHHFFSQGYSGLQYCPSKLRSFMNRIIAERIGSVIECLTWDREAASSSLTGVTVLCPWARHINHSLKYWFKTGRLIPW